MSPSNLIAEAFNDIYCTIAPSPCNNGVGVFAIKDIPANTVIFRQGTDYIPVRSKFLSRINDKVAEEYRRFLLVDEVKEIIYIPKKGFSSLDISFYANHNSKNPTARFDTDSGFIISKRLIEVGEEVTYDYRAKNSGL